MKLQLKALNSLGSATKCAPAGVHREGVMVTGKQPEMLLERLIATLVDADPRTIGRERVTSPGGSHR
jgi:hypothetical protein